MTKRQVRRPTENAALGRLTYMARRLHCTETALIRAYRFLRERGESATVQRLQVIVPQFEVKERKEE